MKKRPSRKRRRDPNVYPPGWDYQRTKAIADYYDARRDEQVLDKPVAASYRVGFLRMELPKKRT